MFGYKSENIQVSEFVIKEFLKNCEDNKFFVEVQHEISVPVGYGLGCSGAVALSLAMALNQANTETLKSKTFAFFTITLVVTPFSIEKPAPRDPRLSGFVLPSNSALKKPVT